MNTSDYFAPSAVYSGPSIADYQAQDRIDELSNAFDKFLKEIGCRRTRNSEWYYACPHSGIHAEPNCEVLYLEPEFVEGYPSGLYCDEDFKRVWNGHQPQLHDLWVWLDRNECHLQEAPYEYYGGYVKRSHRNFDWKWQIAYEEYEKRLYATLEELCDAYENLLDTECEYAYSEEAAEDWAQANEWLEEVKKEKVRRVYTGRVVRSGERAVAFA